MEQDNQHLYPDSDDEDKNDEDYNEEEINNIIFNQNQENQENQEDPELKRAIEISIQEYENSKKLVKESFQQIINISNIESNVESNVDSNVESNDYTSNKEFIKSLILENLTDNEREQVIKMVEEYNYNKLARELIEQQKLDYEMSLQQDLIKQEIKDEIKQEIKQEIKDEIKLTKEQLRLERLKFFQKK